MVLHLPNKKPVKFDWQHVAIFFVSGVGALVCIIIPDLAKYVGPLVSGIIPLALAKRSPLEKDSSEKSTDNDTAEITVINVGTTPQELTVGEDGDIRLRWQDKK